MPSTWLAEAKKNAGLVMGLGALQIVIGFVAIGSPLMAGAAIAILVGASLLFAGIVQLLGAFKCGSFGAGTLAFLGGLLAAAAGGYMLARPGVGVATLTLVLAIYFFLDGIERLVLGFRMKPELGWGWSVFGGVLGIVLGIMIWRRWPLSGAWAIGTLVGIHLVFTGMTLVGIGSAARRGVKELQQAAG